MPLRASCCDVRAEDVVVAAHVQDADTVGAVAVVTRAEVAAGADHANDGDCCVTVAATWRVA
jgi:hypothetical protein